MLSIHPRNLLSAFAIMIFIALITLLPSWHFMPKVVIWFIDGQRLLELLLLCVILMDSAFTGLIQNNSTTYHFGFINNYLRYAFLVLLSLTIVSVFSAQVPRHAAIEVSTFAGLCYLTLFAARLYHKNKLVFIQRFTYLIWASIALYMVSFYVGYLAACVSKTPMTWPQPFTGFSNIRSFNQYQLWGLGLIYLPLLAFNLRKTFQICLFIGLIFWWVLLFYSASRGVLIACIAGMLITAITYRRLAWALLRLQLISMVLGYCGYYLLFTVVPDLLKTTLVIGTILRETTSDRIELWSQAFILAKSNPWFGVGPMHYAWHSTSNAHPHNSVLQLASEWGFPATLIILTVTGYSIYCWLKKFNIKNLKTKTALDNNLAIILFFTVISNAIYSLVDGVIVMPISQVLMFTMIGLMIGQYTYGTLTTNNYGSKIRPILASIILATLIWSTFPEIFKGLSGNEKGFSMGYTALGPRFWKEIQ